MRVKPLDQSAITHWYIASSLTPPSSELTLADVAATDRSKGYRKVACHYVIRRDGVIEVGRMPSERGAMTADCNDSTLQIVLIGGADEHGQPSVNYTTTQLASLHELIETRRLPVLTAPGHLLPI